MFSRFMKSTVWMIPATCLMLAGCKPRIDPDGRAFLEKVRTDVSALADKIAHTMPQKDTTTVALILSEWSVAATVLSNQYLAVGLLDTKGTDYYVYDFVLGIGEGTAGEAGDYSSYRAMLPLLRGKRFSTGVVHWEGQAYGIVCCVAKLNDEKCGVVVLFLNGDRLRDARITFDQLRKNLL